MLGRRGSQLPLSASDSGFEMELDLGTPEEVWVGTDYPHLPTAWEGRGVGGTCFSRKGSVLLQRVLSLPFSTFPPATSFPPKRPRATPCQGFESISILRILHPGQEVGRGGCRSEDALGLSVLLDQRS